MSKGKLALGVAAGLFAAYMFAAPYITVYQIKSAAENNDATTLSEYIDFPSLRQSYKGQITAMLEKDMAENEAGIQIISATLMDEWREVANC